MGYKTLKDCTSHIQPSSIFCSGLTNNSSLCFYTIFDFNCFLLGLYTFLIVVLNTAYSESTETSSVCNFFSNTHLQHSLFVQLYSQEKDHGIKTHESFPDMSRHISTTEREHIFLKSTRNLPHKLRPESDQIWKKNIPQAVSGWLGISARNLTQNIVWTQTLASKGGAAIFLNACQFVNNDNVHSCEQCLFWYDFDPMNVLWMTHTFKVWLFDMNCDHSK